MEIILVSGIGTFVLLVAQLLDYLSETPRQPVVSRVLQQTAEKPTHSVVNQSPDVATQYDRAA